MPRARAYVLFVTFVAALGGLLFGFDTAVIAGGMRFLKGYFGLNSLQEGFAVSVLLVGCIFGAAFAGTLSDRLGRRRLLLLAAVLFGVSAVGAALAGSLAVFVVARLVGGLGVGAASILSPLYIAEISPARIRGSMVSLNQMTIVTGILVSYFVGWALAGVGPSNWRWMFGIMVLPAAVFFGLLFLVPESPRWLIKQKRDDEAVGILGRVNGLEAARSEAGEIKAALALESGSLRELFQPGFRKALVLGVVLAVFQQITGINTVIYYAPRIFEQAGLGRVSALLQSTIVGAVNVLLTLVAIFFVDRLGRKPLLLVASAGMGVSFGLLGAAFYLRLFAGPWVLVLVLLYIAFFAMAMGPIVWVVIAEIFPTRVRGAAMSIAIVFLWAADFVVSLTFPVMADKLSEAATFWIYALVCAASFIFILRALPETKGRTLEEIEQSWL
jgi:SP family arabinose:H+ symporter-like MFS transporter